jgi:hypothetical protein
MRRFLEKSGLGPSQIFLRRVRQLLLDPAQVFRQTFFRPHHCLDDVRFMGAQNSDGSLMRSHVFLTFDIETIRNGACCLPDQVHKIPP